MIKPYCFLILWCLPILAIAQSKESGPYVLNYGAVFPVNDMTTELDTARTYSAVFDIMISPEDPSRLNRNLETAARFLNMHGQHGVPLAQLKIALVIHGGASKDVLNNTHYHEKFGMDNPNRALLEALLAAGADVAFCGQSLSARGYQKDHLLPGVAIHLSAMTALISYQDQSYRLIKF